ncbi:hypothetical protein HZA45_00955 [Candidatus Peregrinibacteria bacterium]|nr:hypothetical protein [Candidatus Peregrinibacteria bacterium]
MKFLSSLPRLLSPLTAFVLGLMAIAGSGVLLTLHASVIRQVQEQGLPAAVTIPPLEKRLQILKSQIEVSELQQAAAQGSSDEVVSTFVLPASPDLDRVLTLLTVLHDHFRNAGQLRAFAPVQILPGEPLTDVSGITAHPLRIEAEVTEEGLMKLLTFFRLSGLLTISDALRPAEIQNLLAMTEQQDPSSVAVIEHFLSVPVLRYALDPKPYDQEVMRAFTGETAQLFSEFIAHSDLAQIRDFFSGEFGRVLVQQHLWPVRFLTADRMTVTALDGEWRKVSMEVRAYSKL